MAHEHERRAREICNAAVLTNEARDADGAETLVESHRERRKGPKRRQRVTDKRRDKRGKRASTAREAHADS